MTRPIHEIAKDIKANWPNVNFAARPYLDAMFSLNTVRDAYGFDSARSVIAYFLGNARTWRGEAAVRIKAELNAMLKGA